MQNKNARACAAALAGALALLATSATARADSIEDFYKGKTITVIVGYSVGGGYDLYGRLVARHLGKHIPGHPNLVVQNMTGAGSLRSALFLYSVAPKDGTAIGTFGRTIALTPLLTPQTANFDGTKFNWLGSVTNEVSTCVTWHTSKVKSWKDALTTEIPMGGEGPGADPDVYTLLYNNVFGTKFKLATGYHGTNETTLAMERGEVDGLCGLSWSTLKSKHQDWMDQKKINFLVQAALKKQPELSNVPLAPELTNDPEKLQILKVFLVGQEIARPFTAPPGIPADRKAALAKAFDEMVKDPEFIADAKKLKADVNPTDAKTMSEMLAGVYATPKAVLEKAAKATTKQ
jgi:tripartite-type tricarboxylate transporter receptor subunit TctC